MSPRFQRSILAVVSLIIVAVPLSRLPEAQAGPPNPEVDMWNENDAKLNGTEAGLNAWLAQYRRRITWNCYNYGVNRMTVDGMGRPVRAHPGRGQAWPNLGNAITAAQMCTKARTRAAADGLQIVNWNPGDPIPNLPMGQNLVALGAFAGIKGNGADYHWWRRNTDGSWSHKRGGTKAKTTYTAGDGTEQPLTDPREAGQRDGYDLCGFMAVKKATPPNVGALAAAPSCGPQSGHVVLKSITPSGPTDGQMVLSDQQLSEIAAFLPTMTPSNEISTPDWPGVPAGQNAGYEMFDERSPTGAFVTLRVWNGDVGVVHFRFDRGWNLYYYNDDNGLENELTSVFAQRTVGACCGGADKDCLVTTPCTCEEHGGFYQGDGTTCATPCGPVAVELSSFDLTSSGGQVFLAWETSFEQDNLEFNVFRSPDDSGDFEKVNDERIPAATDGGEGANYHYVDREVEVGRSYAYQIEAVDAIGGRQLFDLGAVRVVPAGLALHLNRPNPFNPATEIQFELPAAEHVVLRIHDVAGRLVRTLVDADLEGTVHTATWDGTDDRGQAVGAGVYVYRLQSGGAVISHKMVLMK